MPNYKDTDALIKKRANDPDVIHAAKRLRSPPDEVANAAIKYDIPNAVESINIICIMLWGCDYVYLRKVLI